METNSLVHMLQNISILDSNAPENAGLLKPLNLSPTDGNPEARERAKKFHEGLQHSRSFVLLYQPLILGIVISFAIRHFLQLWRRKQRKRAIEKKIALDDSGVHTNEHGISSNGQTSTESSSLSGRTLDGDPTSIRKDGEDAKLQDEESPLLSKKRENISRGHISDKIRGIMMYQPSSIPVIGRALPSNSTTFFVMAVLGLNVFFLLFHVSFTIDLIIIFADRAGLVFAINLPWLYLLAAKNQPTRFLTGHSYEALNILHRRLGEWLCLLAVLHFGGMIAVWFTILRPIGITFSYYLAIPIILLGIGTFASYELLYLTSLRSFRQQWYELFLASHIFLQIAALVLLYLHHHGSRPYVIASSIIFALDRLYFRLYSRTITASASVHPQQDASTVVVKAKVPLTSARTSLLTNHSVQRNWYPGLHVFLSVPALSPKHIIQAHPFSILSPPASEPSKSDVATLMLLIRAQDGFTLDLLRHARQRAALASNLTVRLDGPYGSHSAFEMLEASDIAVLVAGGSGIAVTWPMVWCLSTPALIDLETGLRRHARRKILFVWVVRSNEQVEWVTQDRLWELEEDRGVSVMIPTPTEKSGDRPNVTEIMQTWLEGLGERWNAKSKVGVVVSGPDSMTRSVRNGCAGLVSRGYDVEVEVEKFGW